MRNAKSILSMTVVNLASGERIGRVRDLIIDPEQRQIAALVMKPRGLFSGGRAVLYDGVRAIGKDAVVVKNESFIVRAEYHPDLKPLLNKGIVIVGKPVMTEGGWLLGSIKDIILDERQGTIHGYVMSALAVRGLPRGFAPVLPAQETIVVGRHLAMVTDRVEYLLQQSLDEARGASAKEKAASQGGFWRRFRQPRPSPAVAQGDPALRVQTAEEAPLAAQAEELGVGDDKPETSHGGRGLAA